MPKNRNYMLDTDEALSDLEDLVLDVLDNWVLSEWPSQYQNAETIRKIADYSYSRNWDRDFVKRNGPLDEFIDILIDLADDYYGTGYMEKRSKKKMRSWFDDYVDPVLLKTGSFNFDAEALFYQITRFLN